MPPARQLAARRRPLDSRGNCDGTAFALAWNMTGASAGVPEVTNPAVTLARSFTNTFASIRPSDAPGFMVAQLAGALAASALFKFLAPAQGAKATPVKGSAAEKEAA